MDKNLYFKRTSDKTRFYNKAILIVCEGTETEPNYFNSFRVKSAKVIAKGVARNTIGLVEYAKEIYDEAKYQKEIFDEVWCVFDKDNFSIKDFNDAIAKAKKYKNFKVAYSNESFELWFLLHFCYQNTAVPRSDYLSRLGDYLEKLYGGRYDKNDRSIYEKLLPYQEVAIRNAKKLLDSYSNTDPFNNSPSTTVHLLVEELNKYKGCVN
ncbi:abortive phage infection protein [Candidatus Falkowbacteria bacterium CG_4_10_14_0_2_um_filter_41_15]|uniref:Abortive phage infection protein n=2 Tax=Candidatus Falkowiibacteriota TaxID=1752728 RepID=A0A2G9ZNR4_9BACT|nr:MAG: abortive phage infection protein [Candidatus Falkowbacteria bacterium CG23_combo_of_CG06-09_8_20_14_all_41_10]PJA10342.1 MAG: abortive phage infection protein [Candidatus Falkowbacteria bacterium CG_4_10_14_0_2_um_filter_41_15]